MMYQILYLDKQFVENIYTKFSQSQLEEMMLDMFNYMITVKEVNRNMELLKSDKTITCLSIDENSNRGYCIIEDPEDKLVYFDLQTSKY